MASTKDDGDEMETAAKKLWDAVEDADEDDEAVDLMETFVHKHKDDRPELLLIESREGVSLTEFLSSVEPGACVRDARVAGGGGLERWCNRRVDRAALPCKSPGRATPPG